MGRKGHWTRGLGAVIAGLLVVGLTVGSALNVSRRSPSHPPSVRVAASTTTPPPQEPSPWPRPAWVDVAVANVWDHVDSARSLDAAMSGSTPSITTWLAGLDYHGRLALDDLLATQVLLYDPVVVLDQQGAWFKVRVTGQTGAYWRNGIEGWVPAGQISFRPPPTSQVTATVARNLVSAGPFRLSYGTSLPVLRTTRDAVTVAVPGGEATVPARDLRTGPLPPSGPGVVAQAEKFLGLPYLWAGMSSYGFDCSGLTSAVYRQFGITLPRDAADQAAAGAPVARSALAPGDLVFYAWGGPIDHVGIYAGNGKMIDAPNTGGAVELVNMWGTPLAAHFVAAARYLPK